MNPKCVQCEKIDSILWRKDSEGAEICNECFEANQTPKPEEVKEEKTSVCEKQPDKETPPKDIEPSTQENKTRKSTRSTRFKSKAITRQKSTKSVSRRSNIFKSSKPFKTPSNICAETKTKTNLFLDGFYYQIGDIVAVRSKGKLFISNF